MSAVLDLSLRKRGLFVKLPSTQVIDLAAAAGFDFVIVDLEHSQLDFGSASALVRHADAHDLPALVRLPTVDPGLINRLLEAGAAGIQLSTVTRVEQVRELRRAMDYAPHGTRSIGTAHRGARYGRIPTAQYVAAQRDSAPLAVIQIETPTTCVPVGDLARAGADVVFVGQADLAVALSFDKDQVALTVERIIKAARQAQVAIGGIGLPPGTATYEVAGADLQLLSAAFDRAV